ncbi:MAG TPA: right-handed parallel beta-helix repeat-containing protein, partial [Sandaracinaceae bacterium LLY-WYZ-13_1]|nr:right-handed parallel beta-helix repeat-containing protein [Sandaracinaceae bacterium LLY-WYZ-13_1]
MRRRGMGALALALACGLASEANAETYYVEEGGDDGADGSAAAPWATLQHAADRVAPGDEVVVRPGTYRGFHLTTSGSADAPVTFRAEAGAVVDEDNDTTPDGINLEGASHVVVEGFEVRDVTRAGIRAVTCEHVVIRGNRADENGRWGIFTGFCDDLLIEDNECSRSGIEHGIYVSNSADRPVVRRNRLWGNNRNGLHMNGDASAGGDGVISDALVEANVIWDNGADGGSGINCDGVQDSVIRNNLLYENHASGVSLYRIDGAAGSTGNLVVNNTIVQASDGRWAMNVQNASTGNRIVNNVLLSRHGFRGAIDISSDSLDGLVSDHNVVVGRFTTDGGSTVLDLSEWQASSGQDASSLVATEAEVFVDAAGDDYHLSAGSPAVDAGRAEDAPPTDYEGDPRPAGAAVDAGADERCDGDCDPVDPDGGVPTTDAGSGDRDGG